MNVLELQRLIPKVEGHKISTLDSWEDNIYVGTQDGFLLVFTVSEDGPTGKFTFNLDIKKSLGHGKKPVQQIQVFKDILKLFTLCDGNVDVLNLFTLEPTATMPITKGISLFCSEKRSPLYRICIQVNKKLSFYEYVGNFELIKEIALHEKAVTLEWYNGVVCIGLKKQYVLMELETAEVTPLFPLEKSTVPIINLMSDDILIVKDELGVFISDKGLPTRTNILWNSPPTAVGFLQPYTVALEPKNQCLEVHNILNQALVQSLPFPVKKNFKFIAKSEGSKHMLLASSTTIYTITAMTIEKQIERLLSMRKIKDVIALMEDVTANDRREEREMKLKKVHRECGLVLFRHLDLDDAFSHFQKSTIDPREIIEFYPDLLSIDTDYLPSEKRILLTDLVSILLRDEEAKERTLGLAKTLLINFLKQRLKTRDLSELAVKDIHTALMKLYLQVTEEDLKRNPMDELIALLKSTTILHMQDVEVAFQLEKKYNALGLLYRGAKEYEKALITWSKLGSGEYKDGGFTGVPESVELLSVLDFKESFVNLQLLWKYAEWVLLKNPEKGIQVFTSKLHPVPLDPKQVLEYLSPMNEKLVRLYLEFLVFDCQLTKEPDFPTRLAVIYVNSLLPIVKAKGMTGQDSVFIETRTKLLTLLRQAKSYAEPAILSLIISLPFYEEQIILYSRLNKHQKALEVIVDNLRDYDRAEAYCLEYKNDNTGLTLSLLRVYLADQKEEGDFIPKSALSLLNSHARELDPVMVLPLLPNDMPLQSVSEYLRKSIQGHIHTLRQGQIVKNLGKSESLNVKHKLSLMNKKSVTISKERMCPVCQKRMGDKYFCRFPNGQVVHFKCAGPEAPFTVCPVTGEDFKQPHQFF